MLGAVLAIRSNGVRGACGQTIGADGAGEWVYVIEGEPESAGARARELVRELERDGHRIAEAILVHANDKNFIGPALIHIDAEGGLDDRRPRRLESKRSVR